MDYEHEYNKLIKNVDRYRNELFDQKDMIAVMIKNTENNRHLIYEHRAYSYAISMLDLFCADFKTGYLTDSDRIFLNEKTQEGK